MQTVETILTDVYGSVADAAKALEEKGIIRSRSTVWNWKAWGYFPSRMLPQILADAASKKILLAVSEMPVMPMKPAKARGGAAA